MSDSTSKHITAVIGFLNERARYAVLRNFEQLPESNASRDIDIIITRDSWHEIQEDLLNLILSNGWQIVIYLHSDRLITYVLSVGSHDQIELVQWDFFFNTSVWGVMLMDAEEFLTDRKFNGFLYHVSPSSQFLDKYLYNRAVGSPYPEKYASTKLLAQGEPVVQAKLQTLFGVKSVAEGDLVKGRGLFWHALRWNIRHRGLKLIRDVAYFFYTFVSNYINSPTGFSIGFTGPDGSGKTTVIETLLTSLGDVFGKAHVYFHFRPSVFGNISDVAHSAGLKKEVDHDYHLPHRGSKTNVISSILRLCYYATDYVIGYFLKVKTQTRITRLVIFDRYYTDIICDSRRSRIYLSPRFLHFFGRMFIPSLDYNILLTASTSTILKRKTELDKRSVEDINEKIDFLSNKKGYLKVVNEGKPEDAVSTILLHIFDQQHKKNIKRLRR